jgi:hypothetical protein
MNEVEMDVLMAPDAEAMDTSVSSEEELKVTDSAAPDYAGDYEEIITDGAYTEFAEDVILMAPVDPVVEEKPSRTDNILTLGLVGLLALVVIIAVIRKAISNKRPAPVVVKEIPAVPAVEAPGSAGMLKLYDTDPKTAAMVMAIVADKLQKPLNELRFVSIKEVK